MYFCIEIEITQNRVYQNTDVKLYEAKLIHTDVNDVKRQSFKNRLLLFISFSAHAFNKWEYVSSRHARSGI